MDIIGRAAGNVRLVKGIAKGTQTTRKDCLNETKCTNCQENYLAVFRSCEIFKREENHEDETRKILESYTLRHTIFLLYEREHLC